MKHLSNYESIFASCCFAEIKNESIPFSYEALYSKGVIFCKHNEKKPTLFQPDDISRQFSLLFSCIGNVMYCSQYLLMPINPSLYWPVPSILVFVKSLEVFAFHKTRPWDCVQARCL